uniref:ribonuclease H n=1 Tax=Leptobrachium leishanense TaxID=445787 RepID=A0A8C5QBL6_9ANUR
MSIESSPISFPPIPELYEVPDHLWSKGPEDIGRLQVPPVLVTLKPGATPPRKPQYPLKPAQSAAIAKQVCILGDSGALVQCTSPCNSPLFPVKKKTPKGEPEAYRMVQDLRAVNEATILDTLLVSNPHTLLSGIPPSACYFTVVDLANAFFIVPLDPACMYLFAFTHDNRQYTWTVMPQGAQNSPTQFSKAMATVLDTWQRLNPQVVLLQYVDELLLCAPSREEAVTTSLS